MPYPFCFTISLSCASTWCLQDPGNLRTAVKHKQYTWQHLVLTTIVPRFKCQCIIPCLRSVLYVCLVNLVFSGLFSVTHYALRSPLTLQVVDSSDVVIQVSVVSQLDPQLIRLSIHKKLTLMSMCTHAAIYYSAQNLILRYTCLNNTRMHLWRVCAGMLMFIARSRNAFMCYVPLTQFWIFRGVVPFPISGHIWYTYWYVNIFSGTRCKRSYGHSIQLHWEIPEKGEAAQAPYSPPQQVWSCPYMGYGEIHIPSYSAWPY